MALDIYATSTTSWNTNNGFVAGDKLPSPSSLKPSLELIWSQDTGRAQTGANKAKMIGDVIAEKKTYNIQWGMLTASELSKVTSKLTSGFFYFGIGTTMALAKADASKFYRGNITYEILPIGNTMYYKSVTVDVIEQ